MIQWSDVEAALLAGEIRPVNGDGGICRDPGQVAAIAWQLEPDHHEHAVAFVERHRPGFGLGKVYRGNSLASAPVVAKVGGTEIR